MKFLDIHKNMLLNTAILIPKLQTYFVAILAKIFYFDVLKKYKLKRMFRQYLKRYYSMFFRRRYYKLSNKRWLSE